MCRRENASKETVNFLLQHGISNFVNFEGGINAYSQLDPNIVAEVQKRKKRLHSEFEIVAALIQQL